MEKWEVALQASVKEAEAAVAVAQNEVDKVQAERGKEQERHAAAMAALDGKLKEAKDRLRGLKVSAKRAQVALNTTERTYTPRKPKVVEAVTQPGCDHAGAPDSTGEALEAEAL
jgi:uncharacterized small protein (DUF1192 family)